MSGTQLAIARTIADADKVSLDRLAWAYGCAPKGSSEEMQLEMLLLARVRPEAEAERDEAREHAEVCLAQMADLERKLDLANGASAIRREGA